MRLLEHVVQRAMGMPDLEKKGLFIPEGVLLAKSWKLSWAQGQEGALLMGRIMSQTHKMRCILAMIMPSKINCQFVQQCKTDATEFKGEHILDMNIAQIRDLINNSVMMQAVRFQKVETVSKFFTNLCKMEKAVQRSIRVTGWPVKTALNVKAKRRSAEKTRNHLFRKMELIETHLAKQWDNMYEEINSWSDSNDLVVWGDYDLITDHDGKYGLLIMISAEVKVSAAITEWAKAERDTFKKAAIKCALAQLKTDEEE